jgi:putative hydrolase of the HAD superfamily
MKDKHLFFDLDRTLWDFDKNSKNALIELFETLQLNQHIPNFEDFHGIYKHHNQSLWRDYALQKTTREHLRDARFIRTLEQFNIFNHELAIRLSNGYIELSPRQTHLHEHAVETLTSLKKSGYNMHIITNGFQEVQFTKMEHAGLKPFFKHVICSEEIGKNKPSPDIFHFALQKANTTPENSVMIGDDFEADIIGSLNVGMHAVHYNPKSPFQHVPTDKQSIRDLAELPDLLPMLFKP